MESKIMLNTEYIRTLFEGNRVQYLSELNMPEQTYYRILKRGTCSIETLVKIATYFDESIESLLCIPEEFYQ
jgi:hypothetical protein